MPSPVGFWADAAAAREDAEVVFAFMVRGDRIGLPRTNEKQRTNGKQEVDMLTNLPTRALLGFAAWLALWSWAPPASAADTISFTDDVFPIIELRCLECHQPGGQGYENSGLDLSSYEGLMHGTKFGPIVVPGDALTSNFIVLVEGRASPEIQMPHNKKKLTSPEISILRRWVNQGAKDN
jgi:hypothetical protein